MIDDWLLGEIKWFNAIRGYGFIKTPKGDVFIHIDVIIRSGIVMEFRSHTPIEVLCEPSPRRPRELRAIDVRVPR